MRRDAVRVGLFVIAAAVILFAGSLWILDQGLFGEGSGRFVVRLPHTGGIHDGDRIRVAGVPAGRIEDIRLEQGERLPVRLEIALDRGIVLYRDANARLMSDSLLSGNYLEIEPGDPALPALEPGGSIAGIEQANFDTVFRQLGTLGSTADVTMAQLQNVVAEISGALTPAIDRLTALLSEHNVATTGQLLEQTSLTMSELRPRLHATLDRTDSLLADLDRAAADLPELAQRMNRLAGSLETAIGPDGRELQQTLQAAHDTLRTAQSTLASLDPEAGDLGHLLADLGAAAADLRTLSKTLSERPSMLLGLRAPRERRPGERPAGGSP